MIGPVSTPPSTKCTVQPATFTPASKRLPLRVHAGERGQQRGVDVDDAAGEGAQDLVAEHAHEPGEHDQLDLLRAQPGHQRAVERGARRVVAVIDDERGQPGRARARQRGAVGHVGAHDGDARRAQLAAAAASSSACRLVPLPETRTPTFTAHLTDELDGRVGRVRRRDLADREHLLAGALEQRRGLGGAIGRARRPPCRCPC